MVTVGCNRNDAISGQVDIENPHGWIPHELLETQSRRQPQGYSAADRNEVGSISKWRCRSNKFLLVPWRTKLRYTYPALRYSQLPSGGKDDTDIVCLVAPCDEMLQWAGIPRKSEEVAADAAGEGERITLHGYQREAESKRLAQLVMFFQNPQNIVPTSILLARRFAQQVQFDPQGHEIDFGGVKAQIGQLCIETAISADAPLSELLSALKSCLLQRNANLSKTTVNEKLLSKWKAKLSIQDGQDHDVLEDQALVDTDEEAEDVSAGNPYSPDTHIEDFYKEIVLRLRLCQELPFLDSGDHLLGLNRQMIMDYLAPVTVVDGQHRLLGAKDALDEQVRRYMNSEEYETRLVADPNLNSEQEETERRRSERRVFSATMLMNSDWTEHVFQFVVVNQKVKPISKALLSSIISTSLSSEEIDNIQNRLQKAGIQIDDYKVMGRLTEDPSSPFKGFVKKGFTADRSEDKLKLEWTVLNGLASDFRELKNLKPYHKRVPGQLDPALEWKERYLLGSGMLDEYGSANCLDNFEAWRNPTQGLWINAFCEFWRRARERLSDDSNDLTRWGEQPKISNIFNGATMSALQSDFFDYLFNKEVAPKTWEDFSASIDAYFSNMKPEFFGRPWNLPGNRVDRANRETTATYIESHRKTGKIDGKWKIFKST